MLGGAGARIYRTPFFCGTRGHGVNPAVGKASKGVGAGL